MKKAVIVVGEHYAGKSLTIRGHLNPLLKISYDSHIFALKGKRGYIRSQSFEESDLDVIATVKKDSGYDLLVYAARPHTDPDSKLKLLINELRKSSFIVRLVNIQGKTEAPKKAKKIFKILKS